MPDAVESSGPAACGGDVAGLPYIGIVSRTDIAPHFFNEDRAESPVGILSVTYADGEARFEIDEVDDTGSPIVLPFRMPTAPAVAPGDTVLFGETLYARWLRQTTGELVAMMIRGSWPLSGFESQLGLRQLRSDLVVEEDCFFPTGGQCGRGVQQFRLATSDGETIAPGETRVLTTMNGDVEVAVAALWDDTYLDPEGSACAIGGVGVALIDVWPAR